MPPQMTAASYPLPIPGDPELRVSPLSDRDIDEINNWLRGSYIAQARASLDPSLMGRQPTQEERDETLRIAMRDARALEWDQGYGARLMGNVRSIARVIWQGLRREHPDLTWDAFLDRLRDAGSREIDQTALAAALRVWEEVNVDRGKRPAKNPQEVPPAAAAESTSTSA